MAYTVYLSEYAVQCRDESGALVPVGNEPALAVQALTLGGESSQSQAFSAKTRFVRVLAEADCSVAFGANPTATTAKAKIPANVPEYFGVQPGQKMALIANYVADTVYAGAGGVVSEGPVEMPKVKLTLEGGIAVKLTNKTGAPSVKGYTVHNNPSFANAVALTAVGDPDCFGVFYESGVADGSEAWVVISGIASVYFIGSVTLGHIARTFIAADAGAAAGKAMSESVPTSPFATDKHFCEIGHVIESRTGAGLAKTILHFN
jgi:hypothetical protein